MRICCDECGTRFNAPNNVTGIRCPECGEDLDLSPRRPKKSGSYAWVVLLVLGIALPVMIGSAVFCTGTISQPSPKNARCPQCGQEFNIPLHHGMGQWTVEYGCPNCHLQFPAAMLYKRQ